MEFFKTIASGPVQACFWLAERPSTEVCGAQPPSAAWVSFRFSLLAKYQKPKAGFPAKGQAYVLVSVCREVNEVDERMLAGYFAAALMAECSLFSDFHIRPVPSELAAGQ